MNTQWQNFLEGAGAQLLDGAVVHFGDEAAERRAALGGDVLCDLSHFGLIAAHGEDAVEFLQNMTTNDLREVSEHRCQLSALLSPKGRMLALFRLFRRNDAFYLRLPAQLLEPTLKRLRMFVLRSKVTLEDESGALARIGASGPNAERLLTGRLGALPAAVDDVIAVDGLTVIRLPGPLPRFELHGEPQALEPIWRALAEGGVTAAGRGPWALLDIEAGLPSVAEGTVEAFVPQMANFQAVNGVSFTKGCYPGQEVVARSEYLGKQKRRMYRARAAADTLPAPGDKLAASGETVGADAGKVVAAEHHPDGGIELLAVIPMAEVEGGKVRLGAEGPELEILDLPYELPEKG